jgi:hypothetical protein
LICVSAFFNRAFRLAGIALALAQQVAHPLGLVLPALSPRVSFFSAFGAIRHLIVGLRLEVQRLHDGIGGAREPRREVIHPPPGIGLVVDLGFVPAGNALGRATVGVRPVNLAEVVVERVRPFVRERPAP